MDRAVEHSAPTAPARYLRKFYPWYVERLGRAASAMQLTGAAGDARRPTRGRPSTPCRGRCGGVADAILPRSIRPSRRCAPAESGVSVPGPVTRASATCPRDVILTPEGLEKLKDELEHLQTDKRREVAERIKEAREFGDISENSEYDDAKNEQAMLEQRIAQLEERLRSAQVDRRQGHLDRRRRRSARSVNVKDEKTGKSQKFTIVGSAEANPAESKLSNESPVGRALHRPQAQRRRRRSRCRAGRLASSRSPRSTSACRVP